MKDKLIKLLDRSYAPYSNFCVSAIVVMDDGTEFSGVNIENKSYGATICAERVAIYNAVSNGYSSFKEIHIMNKTNDFAMPCMLCRQVFTEFFSENTKIFVYNYLGDVKEFSYLALCPFEF